MNREIAKRLVAIAKNIVAMELPTAKIPQDVGEGFRVGPEALGDHGIGQATHFVYVSPSKGEVWLYDWNNKARQATKEEVKHLKAFAQSMVSQLAHVK